MNTTPINSPYIPSLIFEEMREQASWEREPIAEWRKWLGDPRNEETDEEKKAREDREKEERERKEKEEEEERRRKEKEDDDKETLSRAEVERLKRIEKEHRETKEKAEREKKDAERKKAQEEGRWQELVSEAEKKADEAARERDEAKNELVTYKFERRVQDVASNLGFQDASDAYKFLPGDFEKDSDEKAIERALKKVLENKPYLRNEKKASGNGSSGNGKNGSAGSWTTSEIKGMTATQINENWGKPGFQEAVQRASRGE
jgi:hypothetical protein